MKTHYRRWRGGAGCWRAAGRGMRQMIKARSAAITRRWRWLRYPATAAVATADRHQLLATAGTVTRLIRLDDGTPSVILLALSLSLRRRCRLQTRPPSHRNVGSILCSGVTCLTLGVMAAESTKDCKLSAPCTQSCHSNSSSSNGTLAVAEVITTFHQWFNIVIRLGCVTARIICNINNLSGSLQWLFTQV